MSGLILLMLVSMGELYSQFQPHYYTVVHLVMSVFIQLANVFTNLADQFTIFHESGLQHHKAAIKMVSCVHDIGYICNSSLGPAVSTPLQNVCHYHLTPKHFQHITVNIGYVTQRLYKVTS